MSYININEKDIVSFQDICAYFGCTDPLYAGARILLLREYYFLKSKIRA